MCLHDPMTAVSCTTMQSFLDSYNFIFLQMCSSMHFHVGSKQSCFHSLQTWCCAVLQNANCPSLDDVCISLMLIGWQVKYTEEQQISRNRGGIIKDIKIQCENYRRWLQWKLLIAFNSQFHFSSVFYHFVLLHSWLKDQQQHKQEPTDQMHHLFLCCPIWKQTHDWPKTIFKC